jgi:hypothetical protein
VTLFPATSSPDRQVIILAFGVREFTASLSWFEQQSEGADDGESEYLDGGASVEEDELQSEQGDDVCHSQSIRSEVAFNIQLPQEPVASGSSPSKMAKIQESANRQQKKQKRKADESQLHAKRQEMDKAKVRLFGSYLVSSHPAADLRCCEALFLLTGSD